MILGIVAGLTFALGMPLLARGRLLRRVRPAARVVIVLAVCLFLVTVLFVLGLLADALALP